MIHNYHNELIIIHIVHCEYLQILYVPDTYCLYIFYTAINLNECWYPFQFKSNTVSQNAETQNK